MMLLVLQHLLQGAPAEGRASTDETSGLSDLDSSQIREVTAAPADLQRGV